jgi:hypothetical protein
MTCRGAASGEAGDRLLVPARRRYRFHTLKDVAPAVGRARETQGAVRAAGAAELRICRARSEDIAVAMPHVVIAEHARALRVALGCPDLGKANNIGEPAIDGRASTTPRAPDRTSSRSTSTRGSSAARGSSKTRGSSAARSSGKTRGSGAARSSGKTPGSSATRGSSATPGSGAAPGHRPTATPCRTSSEATAARECDADSIDGRRLCEAHKTGETNATRAAAAPLGAERTGATPVATSPRV